MTLRRLLLRLAPILGALTLALAPACQSADDSSIVVLVTSDLKYPDEIDHIGVKVHAGDRKVHQVEYELGGDSGQVRPPLRFALLPDGPADGQVTIEVEGRKGAEAVVSRSATLTFVPGRHVALRMALLKTCVQKTCAGDNTCAADGKCVSRQLSPANLPTYTRGQPADQVQDPTVPQGGTPPRPDGGPDTRPPSPPAPGVDMGVPPGPNMPPGDPIDAGPTPDAPPPASGPDTRPPDTTSPPPPPPPPPPSGCGGKTCDARATCNGTGASARCVCPAGFTDEKGDGTSCKDIDECMTNNGGCDRLATCTNTAGSRVCGSCPMGYSGTGESGCTDIDECMTNNGGCDPLARCVNTAGGFRCGDCPMGYVSQGGQCVDVNECMTNNGGCHMLTTCTNTPGSRTCGACPAGYSGTGATGCVDVDECLSNNGGCHANATCTNTPGSRTCMCRPGYTGNGMSCTSECASNNGGCHANATCANGPTGITCTCNNGFGGDGKTCVENVPPTVVSFTGTPGAGGAVQRNGSLVLRFSEPMTASTVRAALTLQGVPNFDNGTYTWSEGGAVLTYKPPADFASGATITASLSTAAKDANGNSLAAAWSGSIKAYARSTATLPSPYSATVNSTGTVTNFSLIVGDNESAAGSPAYTVGFATFDMKGLPANAIVISATLQVQQNTCQGTPYESLIAGGPPGVRVDYVWVGTVAASHINVDPLLPGATATLAPATAAQGLKTATITAMVSDGYEKRGGRGNEMQVRLRFPQAVAANGVTDRCAFTPATGPTNPPQITVEYEAPPP